MSTIVLSLFEIGKTLKVCLVSFIKGEGGLKDLSSEAEFVKINSDY